MTEELEVDRSARDPDHALHVALRPQPIGLTPAEVRTGGELKPAPRDGIPATAWLHFPTKDGLRAARLPCVVRAYNAKAVEVEGRINAMPWGPVYVWASAVTAEHR